jgi:hypothetical protein
MKRVLQSRHSYGQRKRKGCTKRSSKPWREERCTPRLLHCGHSFIRLANKSFMVASRTSFLCSTRILGAAMATCSRVSSQTLFSATARLAKIAWLNPGFARGIEQFVDGGLDPLLLFLQALKLLFHRGRVIHIGVLLQAAGAL